MDFSSLSRATLSYHYYCDGLLHLDNIKIDDGQFYYFHSEDWGPGTEYLAQNHNWRPGSVRVIFPIGDEGPYHGTPNDDLDNQSVDAAILACNANDVITYPMYGDLSNSPINEAKNIAHMERLADATGGEATHWQDTETVMDLINTSVSEEIKIAGSDIVITENILNTSNIQVDLNSFAANGVPFTPGTIWSATDIASVVIGKYDIQELDSISTSPPEEITITYNINLSNLERGEVRRIAEAGVLNYSDVMDNFQSVPIPITGDPTYVTVTAESDVLVIVDWSRMDELYDANDVDDLAVALDDYAARKNATIYNLSEYRLYWETNISYQEAYSSENAKREWARFLDNIIASLVLDRNAEHVMIVGGDNAIPFYSLNLDAEPAKANGKWENSLVYEPEGGYDISSATDNNLWSDEPYSDLNDDYYPDISIGRLPGNPKSIITTISNSANTYEGENVLVTAKKGSLNVKENGKSIVKEITNSFKYEWGFIAADIFKFYQTRDTIFANPISGQVINGKTFQNSLENNNSIIYIAAHGNDYRELWKPIQQFSDDASNSNIFLQANNTTASLLNSGAHPLLVTTTCHGGIVFPEDDNNSINGNNSMVMTFLENGGAGYIGSTGYYPRDKEDLPKELFINFKHKKSIGDSLLQAKRNVLYANENFIEWCAVFGQNLYGDPTYVMYVPNDPPGPMDYNLSSVMNSNENNIFLNILNYNLSEIETPHGNRSIISINGSMTSAKNMEYMVPVIIETFEIPSSINIDNLINISSSNIDTITNTRLPIINSDLPQKSNESLYLGTSMNISTSYPEHIVDYKVINETSGNRTVVFRIYPVQYNESSNEVYIYKNITFGASLIEEPPKPLAQFSVIKQAKEINLLSGLMDDFYITIKNDGDLDLNNIKMTETFPEGFTLVSSRGHFNETTKTLNIEHDLLSTEVLNNFQTFTYTVRSPKIQGNATYSFDTTITCTDEAGFQLTPISRSVTVNVKKPESDDVKSVISTHSKGMYNKWDVYSVIQAYK
ncbi:MAG: DUF11 domain-containing protein [Bacteroidales bacterium]|nr:DUF11 domain-containing protein [Bacteroidales bacterium]